MTSKRLTSSQIDALEYQTEQAYDALSRAVDTRIPLDAVWARGLNDSYGKSLFAATNSSPYVDWKRDTQRARLFERYVLQYVVGYGSIALEDLFRNGSKPLEPLGLAVVDDADLIDAINNKKISYSQLQNIAVRTVKKDKCEELVEGLEFIRKNIFRRA